MRVMVGIPTARYYEPFWKSMDEFIPVLKRMCDIEVCVVKGMKVAEARNTIADIFLKSSCDYLLFCDDDHVGHSLQMFGAILDPMINNNASMCGIKCHTKIFPYASNLLIYSGVDEEKMGIKKGSGKYMPVDAIGGYAYCDLVGFGMTLVARWAFKVIEPPYFISSAEQQGKEDNYFCDKLVKAGIKPVGCFDFTLQHGEIGRHNAMVLREQGMKQLKEKYPDMKVLVS